MRIVRYISARGEAVGVLTSADHVVDAREIGAVPDPIALLSGGPALWSELQAAAESAAGTPIDELKLLAPLPTAPKFIGVGMNSLDHVEESRTAPRTPELLRALDALGHLGKAFPDPKFPLLFNKQTTSITGPHDEIWVPEDSEQLDYEGEAALIIGRRVRRADVEQAEQAIAGWTVTNDVSVRDWQWETSQFWLGKSFETHGPIGPCIVTADEFRPDEAVIRTWVNGEQRQEGRLGEQMLSPAKIVSLVSQVCTLEPGDIIATGTPGGIGSIGNRWLVPGDRVRVEVTGIGAIVNDVVPEPAASQGAAARAENAA